MLSTSSARGWVNTMTESNNNDDKALEDYLAGDSALSRQYRDGDRNTPSAAMDRAILDAARDAVSGPATQPRRRLTLMWERPWAIAAVVALSAILVISIQREAGLFAPEEGITPQSLDFAATEGEPSAQSVASPKTETSPTEERQAGSVSDDRPLLNRAARKSAPAPAQPESAGPTPAATRASESVVANDELKRERAESATEDAGAGQSQLQEIAVTGSRLGRNDADAAGPTDPVADSVSQVAESEAAARIGATTRSEATRADDATAEKEAASASGELLGMIGTASDESIDDALALINTAWESGDTEKARLLLREFRERHPDVDDERLREALPATLIGAK